VLANGACNKSSSKTQQVTLLGLFVDMASSVFLNDVVEEVRAPTNLSDEALLAGIPATDNLEDLELALLIIGNQGT
jgi:hypothetical protein